MGLASASTVSCTQCEVADALQRGPLEASAPDRTGCMPVDRSPGLMKVGSNSRTPFESDYAFIIIINLLSTITNISIFIRLLSTINSFIINNLFVYYQQFIRLLSTITNISIFIRLLLQYCRIVL